MAQPIRLSQTITDYHSWTKLHTLTRCLEGYEGYRIKKKIRRLGTSTECDHSLWDI